MLKKKKSDLLKQPTDNSSLFIKEVEKAIYQFRKEELPDAETPFHHEAEIWSGLKNFINWLEIKNKICTILISLF